MPHKYVGFGCWLLVRFAFGSRVPGRGLPCVCAHRSVSLCVSGLLCGRYDHVFLPVDPELFCYADQLHLDNSIPLSPQWLYTKPADGKVCKHCSLLGVCFTVL